MCVRFKPFISRSRSDGDFSGLIRRDPRASGFPLGERRQVPAALPNSGDAAPLSSSRSDLSDPVSPRASAGNRRGNNWSCSQGGQRCSCQSDLFTKVCLTTPGIVKLTPTGKYPASRWFVDIFLVKRKRDPKHKKARVRQSATPSFLLPSASRCSG